MHGRAWFTQAGGSIHAALRLPITIAMVGGLAGALLAGVALTLDYSERWQLAGASTASARAMFGALLTGAITATALLFWIRGMLVQLTAGMISPRVLRGYLNDWFLYLAFAFLLAVFTHALVTLLWLPTRDAAPMPAVASLTGAGLAIMALLLIVQAVYDSVRSMSASRVLMIVTEQTLGLVRKWDPARERSQWAAPEPEPGQQLGSVVSPRSGWVTDVDYERMARGLPAGGVASLGVTAGDFVTCDTILATVSSPDADANWDGALIASGFTLDDERHLENDVDYGLQNLVDVALHSLTPGASDRATAFEALQCIMVVLGELLRREPLARVLSFGDERTVVRSLARTHDDFINATLGEMREAAASSPEFTRKLRDNLRRLAASLEADGHTDPAVLIDREAAQLDAVPARPASGQGPSALTDGNEPG